MKRKALATMMAAAMVLSMVGCGGAKTDSTASTTTTEKTEAAATEAADSAASADATVENKDKPLCWFNRQPSSSATGELDKEALNFNGNTYYVGFDANQGAELQGQMVLDYIKKNAETIDRNGDGVIGYVLAIGDIGHNDSIARTRGVRSTLGTGVEADGTVDSTPAGTNVDGKAKVVQDATLEVDGKTYTIRELIPETTKPRLMIRSAAAPSRIVTLSLENIPMIGSGSSKNNAVPTVRIPKISPVHTDRICFIRFFSPAP